ncbi:hypothetical protein [Gryllotalpicola koreensis]|uniref:Uncharacterized protein n=1 Tax=Gryllotalpicola koreensis TaxID=993086 RepID=A0ABP8A370_9MICO
MKVRNIALGENEIPATVTVEMTIDEAAWITRRAGSNVAPDRVVSDEIWDALTGSLFNRFWDDGLDGVTERHAETDVVADPPNLAHT